MMKKLLFLLISFTITLSVFAQEDQFPYGKMLKMTHEELIKAKFKFDDEKNQYVLNKMNGLNTTASVLGALSGTPTNYVPHVNDYKVVIQNGDGGVAYIQVTFYDSEIYHKVLTFAADKGENLLETSSGNEQKAQFNYGGYAFDLSYRTVKQAAAVASRGVAASRDQSYDVYTFGIFTDIQPTSEWLTKQAQKEAKRDAKGKKKQSAADLM